MINTPLSTKPTPTQQQQTMDFNVCNQNIHMKKKHVVSSSLIGGGVGVGVGVGGNNLSSSSASNNNNNQLNTPQSVQTDRIYYSVVQKQSQLGMKFNKRLFYLVDENKFGYLSNAEDINNFKIENAKQTVSLTSLRKIEPKGSIMTLVFQAEDKKKGPGSKEGPIVKKWVLKMKNKKMADAWTDIINYQVQQIPSRKTTITKQQSNESLRHRSVSQNRRRTISKSSHPNEAVQSQPQRQLLGQGLKYNQKPKQIQEQQQKLLQKQKQRNKQSQREGQRKVKTSKNIYINDDGDDNNDNDSDDDYDQSSPIKAEGTTPRHHQTTTTKSKKSKFHSQSREIDTMNLSKKGRDKSKGNKNNNKNNISQFITSTTTAIKQQQQNLSNTTTNFIKQVEKIRNKLTKSFINNDNNVLFINENQQISFVNYFMQAKSEDNNHNFSSYSLNKKTHQHQQQSQQSFNLDQSLIQNKFTPTTTTTYYHQLFEQFATHIAQLFIDQKDLTKYYMIQSITTSLLLQQQQQRRQKKKSFTSTSTTQILQQKIVQKTIEKLHSILGKKDLPNDQIALSMAQNILMYELQDVEIFVPLLQLKSLPSSGLIPQDSQHQSSQSRSSSKNFGNKADKSANNTNNKADKSANNNNKPTSTSSSSTTKICDDTLIQQFQSRFQSMQYIWKQINRHHNPTLTNRFFIPMHNIIEYKGFKIFIRTKINKQQLKALHTLRWAKHIQKFNKNILQRQPIQQQSQQPQSSSTSFLSPSKPQPQSSLSLTKSFTKKKQSKSKSKSQNIQPPQPQNQFQTQTHELFNQFSTCLRIDGQIFQKDDIIDILQITGGNDDRDRDHGNGQGYDNNYNEKGIVKTSTSSQKPKNVSTLLSPKSASKFFITEGKSQPHQQHQHHPHNYSAPPSIYIILCTNLLPMIKQHSIHQNIFLVACCINSNSGNDIGTCCCCNGINNNNNNKNYMSPQSTKITTTYQVVQQQNVSHDNGKVLMPNTSLYFRLGSGNDGEYQQQQQQQQSSPMKKKTQIQQQSLNTHQSNSPSPYYYNPYHTLNQNKPFHNLCQQLINKQVQRLSKHIDRLDISIVHPAQFPEILHLHSLRKTDLSEIYRCLCLQNKSTQYVRSVIKTQIALECMALIVGKKTQEIVLKASRKGDGNNSSSNNNSPSPIAIAITNLLNIFLGKGLHSQSTYNHSQSQSQSQNTSDLLWKVLTLHSQVIFGCSIQRSDIHKGYFMLGLGERLGLSLEIELPLGQGIGGKNELLRNVVQGIFIGEKRKNAATGAVGNDNGDNAEGKAVLLSSILSSHKGGGGNKSVAGQVINNVKFIARMVHMRGNNSITSHNQNVQLSPSSVKKIPKTTSPNKSSSSQQLQSIQKATTTPPPPPIPIIIIRLFCSQRQQTK